MHRLLLCLALLFPTSEVAFQEILKSPGADWLTYSGDYAATRYSKLNQINRGNVSRVVAKWAYHPEGETGNLRVTPLVRDGIMYITNAYQAEALDAVAGRTLWRWHAPEYPDYWMNRGAALLGDKIFFVTKNCVLTALDAQTGKLKWRTKYADEDKGYFSTVAPLALKDRVIVGVSGGSRGVRGFLAAFSAEEGKELWRFWTVPEGGTLKGGAATWTTGSYDPELGLLYWATGNPWPDFEGKTRPGDNLYSDCVLALDPDSGDLKWHFQFTPHDLHSWDASEPLVLADMVWRGQPRRLLMQANRNGFFYVLDRTSGEFLSGTPFVEKLTWAKGLDQVGRPVTTENNVIWKENKGGLCPGLVGATNWQSPSYDPETGLFYVVLLESCDLEPGNHFLRALDPLNGKTVWTHKMSGRGASMYAGTVSTAGGLVFAGDDEGRLLALDSKTGKVLWQFTTGQSIFASPMTYSVGGKQYVAIAAGSNVFAFGLPGENK